MPKFTQIPNNTFEQLQINAGLLLKTFDPATGVVKNTDIIGATTGGLNFTATPSYTDYGEDIDNCPTNMAELKRQDSVEVKLSGTLLTITADSAKDLISAADVDAKDKTKVVPRNDLKASDFVDRWWVGDYGESGFIAIRLMKTLNTGGFQLQSTDKGKGQFAFELTAHYSMDAQDTVPYELYVSGGAAA